MTASALLIVVPLAMTAPAQADHTWAPPGWWQEGAAKVSSLKGTSCEPTVSDESGDRTWTVKYPACTAPRRVNEQGASCSASVTENIFYPDEYSCYVEAPTSEPTRRLERSCRRPLYLPAEGIETWWGGNDAHFSTLAQCTAAFYKLFNGVRLTQHNVRLNVRNRGTLAYYCDIGAVKSCDVSIDITGTVRTRGGRARKVLFERAFTEARPGKRGTARLALFKSDARLIPRKGIAVSLVATATDDADRLFVTRARGKLFRAATG
jgi:hypothetical protein